jgi:hypothetical protein
MQKGSDHAAICLALGETLRSLRHRTTLQHDGARLLPIRAGSNIQFRPDIWNSDRGSQSTSAVFLAPLKKRDIAISMDGRALITC